MIRHHTLIRHHPKVLKNEHRRFVLSLLRGQLDEINASAGDDDINEIAENLTSGPSQSGAEHDWPELRGTLLLDGHVMLRSRQPTRKLSLMEDSFRTELSVWLGHELAHLEVPVPCAVDLGPDDYVSNASAPCASASLIPFRLPNIDRSRSSTSPWLISINT
jgi:hypothetical protein